MNFATQSFLVFLTIVFGLVLAVNAPKWRKALLLAASYLFYATWNVPFIALILLSTSVDYFLSKKICAATKMSERKSLLAIGICLNVLVLGVFKYFNFFVDALNASVTAMHLPSSMHHLTIILPLGISFYTFEAISYLVDVYRGDEPATDFFDYNFYIMYFPHLISGPIVRYRELSSQVKNGVTLPSIDTLAKGFELIILGLCFKLLLADTVSSLADPVFQNIRAADTASAYVAWAAFTAQIYFDFMGYTHIARGVSLLFNIELPLNFNHPYNAANVSDFWQRWHISLSRWIRDYLFIPLGGSRGSASKTSANLLLTMTIAGLWHGAGWAFIIWGAYHGLLLLLYHTAAPIRALCKKWSDNARFSQIAYRLFSSALTLLLVSYGWIWFRSTDASTAMTFTGKLFRLHWLVNYVAKQSAAGDYTFVATMVLLLLCCTIGPLAVYLYQQHFKVPFWIKVQAATTALVFCYIVSGAESKPFIYFQF